MAEKKPKEIVYTNDTHEKVCKLLAEKGICVTEGDMIALSFDEGETSAHIVHNFHSTSLYIDINDYVLHEAAIAGFKIWKTWSMKW